MFVPQNEIIVEFDSPKTGTTDTEHITLGGKLMFAKLNILCSNEIAG